MRVFIFILMSVVVAAGQSSEELRKKFGEPTSETRSEVFTVRPYDKTTQTSVVLTVTYAKNGEITQWQVELFPYWQDRSVRTTKEENDLKNKILNQAVDEIFPSEKRGKNIINGFLSGSCSDDDCSGSWQRYENVTIFFSGNNHKYARIRPGSELFRKISTTEKANGKSSPR